MDFPPPPSPRKQGEEFHADAVEVILPLPMDHGFDYAVPSGMALAPGMLVRVPFGRREMLGMVAGPARGDVPPEKRKFLHGPAGDPALARLPDKLRELIEWVAWYTLSPIGLVLKMALPDAKALETTLGPPRFRLAENAPLGSAQRKRMIELLADGTPRTAADIAAAAGTGLAPVRNFAKAGGLVELPGLPSAAMPHPHFEPPPLPPLFGEQKAAAEQIAVQLDKGFQVCLLDGVTGSGKTEVYFDTIHRTLASGKQVLMLLPEIALSLPWIHRFTERFGTEPAVWHSGISPARKRAVWKGVRESSVRLVVGARSSLFLPFPNLGLILVDEEHDPSYKQEDHATYHARDMAVARARIEGILCILASATPALESHVNAHSGRYHAVRLTKRYGAAELPKVETIDLRQERLPPNQFLSQPLQDALIGTLAAGHQALLFLNRRGYSPLVLCRGCGHRFACPNCDAWLVFHRSQPRLTCHHCGHTEQVPHACPQCHEADTLLPFGPGAERIAEEVHHLLPQARIGLMTSDAVHTPAQMEVLLQRVEEGTIDVIVGTQMIAKGHHFPGLALVGVVDADMGLAGSDFRAAERTYQLLHQVAGRAGREVIRGRVLLQTFLPEHPVMQTLIHYDRDQFLALEAEQRQLANLPPYGRMAALIVEGPDMNLVRQHAQKIAACAPALDGFTLLGPAPAPLALLRGQYRMRLLIQATRQTPLQQLIPTWLAKAPTPRNLLVKVDIDPTSFL